MKRRRFGRDRRGRVRRGAGHGGAGNLGRGRRDPESGRPVQEPQGDQGAEPVQERSRRHRHRDQARQHRAHVGPLGDALRHPRRHQGALRQGERRGRDSASASSSSSTKTTRADAARNVTAAQKLVEAGEGVRASCPRAQAGDASGKYLHDQKIPAVGWQLGLAGVRHLPELLRHAERQRQETSRTTSRRASHRGDEGARRQEARHHRLQRGEQRRVHRADKSTGEQDQGPEDSSTSTTTSRWAPPSSVRSSTRSSSRVPTPCTPRWPSPGTPRLMNALKQAGVMPKIDHLPRRLQPAGPRPSRVRQRVLRHRVQAVRDHATKS